MDSSATTATKLFSAQEMLVVSVCLLCLTAAFIAMRFGVSLKNTGKLFADDYVSLAGLIVLVANFTLNYEGILVLNEVATAANPVPLLVLIFQLGEACIFTGGAVAWLTKAPILLLLIRLFGVTQWLRIVSTYTLIVSAVIIAVSTIYSASFCNPQGTWSLEFSDRCSIAGARGGLVTGFVGLLSDVIIFVLPLPIIYNLRLPLRKKLGLTFVFMVGIFALLASIAGIYFKVRSLSGALTDAATSGSLTCIECCIALMVSCVPATYSFWATIIVETALYKSVRSMVSRVSLASSRASKRSSRSSDAGIPNSDDDVPESQYARMEAGREKPGRQQLHHY